MTPRPDRRSVVVPASTANLGAGFDVLGLALALHAHIATSSTGPRSRLVDQHHPASVAFRRAGGTGPVHVDAPIPIGRGLGFSGAMRAGGAALAIVSRRDVPDGRVAGSVLSDSVLSDSERAEAFAVAADLEGHGDNAAASVYGGLVAVAGDRVVEAPIGFDAAYDPVVVVWVPDGASTSTTRSRGLLPAQVDRADAVFNLGRVAALVAGFASGDPELVGYGVDDRWHTDLRLAAAPSTARAVEAARASAADAVWLSGSGPSVAMLCGRPRAADVAAALPSDGHVKVLDIDRRGVTVTG